MAQSPALILSLALISPWISAYAASPTGPAVGDRIPDFAAPDQNGRLQSLKTIAGSRGAMLVFYRSADW